MATSLKNIDVFILCGGLGKRLKAVSGDIPKPMVTIKGRPFLDIIIDYMSNFGFKRFILGTGYKVGAIKKYYSKTNKQNSEILFSYEKIPLDTGGALKNARKLIKSDPFIVINGDTFCKFNPLDLLRFHQQKKSLTTILLRKVPDIKDYGEVKIDKASRILNFNEKNGKARKGLINAGIYIFDKKIFSLMPLSNKFSLEDDFFPKLFNNSFFGYTYDGFFIDIGTPQRYFRAQRYFK